MDIHDIIERLKDKAHVAVSIPAIMCFMTFVANVFKALSDGNIDCNEMHTLLASADGFESILLFIVAYVLRRRDN